VEIPFRSITRGEWFRGSIASTLFAFALLAMALGLPIGRRHVAERIAYFAQHPGIYFSLCGAVLVGVIWLFGPMVFGWIPRAVTNRPAAILDDRGIRAWTSRGWEEIQWNDLRSIATRRPRFGETTRYVEIKFVGRLPGSSMKPPPSISIASDTMEFRASDVLQYIRNKRPDIAP